MNKNAENLQELEGLKSFMSQAKNVEHWNRLREEAKDRYSETIISMLDASGFIAKVLPISNYQK
jgi:hypothetical protein